RPKSQGFECGVGAFGSHCRYHDNRARLLNHDPVEAGEPVHFGHMDVEGHHVRTSHLDNFERLAAVAGKPDLEIGLRRKDLANQLANESRVVDHQYFDHGFVCRLSLLRVSLLKESNRPRSARVSSSEGSSKSTIRPDASRL